MISTKQIERLKRIHSLIKHECTGTPDVFASKLNISRRQLYNELDFFKIQSAPLKYCREKESFIYTSYFELEIIISIKILDEKEIKEIYAGTKNASVQVFCMAQCYL